MTGIEVKTPESPQPALAEISQVSSTDDSDDDDDIVKRTLVVDESPLMTNQLGVVENIQQLDKDKPVFGSEISMTSSDATVVASWNLSPDMDEIEDDNIYENKSHQKPEVYIEEPPEEQHIGSCNGGLNLTPKQLAEMLFFFDGAKKLWVSRSADEPTEKPASDPLFQEELKGSNATKSSQEWKRRAETLEQQCATMKTIARVDSANLVKLKRTVEMQREINSKKDIELHAQKLKLQALGQRVETMTKEADIRRETELELLETIRVLKEEVDQMSKASELSKVWKSRQTQRARYQNQILAAQILKTEMSVTELQSTLQQKEKENADLRCEVEALTARLGTYDGISDTVDVGVQTIHQDTRDATIQTNLQDTSGVTVPKVDQGTSTTNIAIAEALQQLSLRLQAVERGTVGQEDNTILAKTSESCPVVYDVQEEVEEVIQISKNQDEIEVFFASDYPNGELDYMDVAQQNAWCCGPWRVFS